MITLQQIYDVLVNKQYAELRELWESAATEDIEHCDASRKIIVMAAMLDATVFRGASGDHDRRLVAIVECIERGKHPYEDKVTVEILESLGAYPRRT